MLGCGLTGVGGEGRKKVHVMGCFVVVIVENI